MNQLLLQLSILLFELTHHEAEEEVVTLANRKFALASIMTSIFCISFGLSTIWLQKFESNPSMKKKMKLTMSNLPDVLMRLLLIVSIALFSFRWRYGLIAVIGTVCLMTIFAPSLICFVWSIFSSEKVLMMNRSLLITPMFFTTAENSNPDGSPGDYSGGSCVVGMKILKDSRMKNKLCGIVISSLGLTFLWLDLGNKIPLPMQDAW